MDSEREIRGEPIEIDIAVNLETAYQDREARWVMISVRNVTQEQSPVVIAIQSFRTQSGDVVTGNVQHPTPNEVNLWIHVLDVPVGQEMVLKVQVGATERGAYRLETLVMPFDRAYEPVKDADGNPISLFSFTTLGVNKPTSASLPGAAAGGNLLSGKKLPGLDLLPALAAVGAAAVVATRRWRA